MYIHVFVNGELLFIGDCHAAQSRGEITGTAIEVPGDVHFSMDVKKNKAIGWLYGENGYLIFTISSTNLYNQDGLELIA